jgi:S1-C subfamily serine protease
VGQEGEEFDDLEGGTSPSGGPWLPPDDRLWRHPSEMAGLEPGAPRAERRSSRRGGLPRRWWPVAGAALAGAVLASGATTAVATTTTWMSGHGASSVTAQRAGTASDPPASTARAVTRAPAAPPATDAVPVPRSTKAWLLHRLGPALVAVDTQGAGGSHHGTGLVFTTNGMIMTAASLVTHQQTINVVSSTGQEWSASLVGEDHMTGIAVIRVSGTGLTPAPLGSAIDMVPDQLTWVMSSSPSPYGTPTVVAGNVEAVQDTITLSSGDQLTDGIEANVPATVDQPGGALLDEKGDVVGIILGTTAGTNDNMCAATPIDDASSAAAQLAATGVVVRAYLGISGRDVVAGDQESLGTATGVEVSQVTPKSPAAIVGLQPGNVITAFNGQPVQTTGGLQHLLNTTQPNTTATLSVVVDQVPRTVHVVLGKETG